MADRIIVRAEAFQAAKGAYNDAREQMEEAFNHLRTARESLDGCWEGSAKQRYIARWESIYSNLVKSYEVVDRALQGLDTAVNIYDEGEGVVKVEGGKAEVGRAAPNVF